VTDLKIETGIDVKGVLRTETGIGTEDNTY
jgi:hypothetical protein